MSCLIQSTVIFILLSPHTLIFYGLSWITDLLFVLLAVYWLSDLCLNYLYLKVCGFFSPFNFHVIIAILKAHKILTINMFHGIAYSRAKYIIKYSPSMQEYLQAPVSSHLEQGNPFITFNKWRNTFPFVFYTLHHRHTQCFLEKVLEKVLVFCPGRPWAPGSKQSSWLSLVSTY